jgi:hypothetical protein
MESLHRAEAGFAAPPEEARSGEVECIADRQRFALYALNRRWRSALNSILSCSEGREIDGFIQLNASKGQVVQ